MEYFKLICIYIIIIFIIYLLYDIITNNISENINDIPMYCIYIPEREKYIRNFFSQLNLQPNFIQGIDKNTIDVDKLIKNNKVKHWKNVNQGRIACHYSHLKALKEFLDTDKERCIIFEDDINTDYTKINLLYIFNHLMYNLPKNTDLLYIGYCGEKCDKNTKYDQYYTLAYKPYCRHAYSVNRYSAQEIIDKTSMMYYNGDKMISDLIHDKTLICYLSNYQIFTQNREEIKTVLGNKYMKLPLCI